MMCGKLGRFFCVNRHHVGTGAVGVQVKVIMRTYSALKTKQDHLKKNKNNSLSIKPRDNKCQQSNSTLITVVFFYCAGNYICVPFNLIFVRAIKRAVKSRIPATVSKTKFLQRISHSHAHLHRHASTHASCS